jgi:tetratricopeptide (TPR) repeat protein
LNSGKSARYVRQVLIYAALAAGALGGVLTLSTDSVSAVGTAGPAWQVTVTVPAETLRAGAMLDRVAQDLTFGAPAQARHVLSRYFLPPAPRSAPTVYRLFAMAAYADSEFAVAGRYFAAAAERADGPRRGVLEARAADAFDRAGLARPAATYYRTALRHLPQATGWMAIRLARLVPDTATAFELLRRAPPEASRLALETRAAVLATAGDVTSAEAALTSQGRSGLAAQYAMAVGDTARAQRLAYAALGGSDSTDAAAGVDLLADASGMLDPEQRFAVARALERRWRYAEAARLFGQIVRGGDSASATLLAWGRALERAGDRPAAMRAYQLAEGGAGADAASAEFARARLLLRSGRVRPGLAALMRFARAHPEHADVPAALVAIADARLDRGDRRRADSLYEAVARGWPRSPVASEARFRLAGRWLQRGNPAKATFLYRDVVQEAGPSVLAARYALGRLAMQRHDTAAAMEQWRALAQDDPLGYYGILARKAARMEPLSFHDPGPPASTPGIERAVATVGLLDAIAFDDEADALVEYLTNRPDFTAVQLLELADGMLGRGRMTVASSLGWRAARTLSLVDPRVLRVVFPWPWRRVIEAEARQFDIDPYLLAAVIRQESGFRRAIVSHAGAWGLMQIMPGTARMTASRLGLPWHERLLTAPDANVRVGAAHLAMLLRRFRGTLAPALAAYNAGARPVERWAHRPGAKDAFWFIEEIPYPETKGYVRSVMRNLAVYQALYAGTTVR